MSPELPEALSSLNFYVLTYLMTFESDYHGWIIPEDMEEEDEWGKILNNFFAQLDSQVVKKGKLVDRPSAGTEGRWYIAVDDSPSPSISYDNGSEWVGISGGSGGGGWGTTGDYVQLASSGSGKSSMSTTATTYTSIYSSAEDTGVVPAGKDKPANISSYAVSLTCSVSNDVDSETTNVRLYDETNATAVTESNVAISETTQTPVHTPIVEYDPGSDWSFNVEASVTGGTGKIGGSPSVILWGVIG